MKHSTLLPIIFFSCLLSGCMGVSALTSSSPQQDITSDGDLVEWIDHMHEYEEGRLRIGVLNDAGYVYLAISSSNRSVIQNIMTGGLTVWLNRDGDKSEEVGIRYPLGMEDFRTLGTGRPAPANNEAGRNKLIEQTLMNYEIMFEDGKARRIPVGSGGGLRLGASYDYGVFSVEMAFPMLSSNGSDIFIDPADGLLFGLGIQTHNSSGMRRGSNTPTGGGATERGSRGSTMGNSGIPVYPPVDLWIAVTLN